MGSTHIAVGYEVYFSYFAITSHGEKVIGPQTLIQYPSFTPGNRLFLLRDIQEISEIWPIFKVQIIFGVFSPNQLTKCYHSKIVLRLASNGAPGIAFGQ